MKLEIELDLNRIDYDAINQQIIEKIAAVDIKDMYVVESRIGNKVHSLVNEAVEDAYGDYLSKYWGSSHATDNGKRFINDVIRDEIKSRSEGIIESIFANEYSEEVIREVALKMLPDVFAYSLFTKVRDSLWVSDINYQEMVHAMITDEIKSTIDGMKY